MFQIKQSLSATPLKDLQEFYGWRECNSNSLDSTRFSAVAYFFNREIYTNLNVPVGLVESTWSGTRIEPWTASVGFKKIPSLAQLATRSDMKRKLVNTQPMAIYSAMIAPIAGFAIRVAVWCQGESNRGDANYDLKMSALVSGWRRIWNEGNFPFYFVQIAPFKYYGGKVRRAESPYMLPKLWLQQSRAARHIKNTGMVVTTDLVDDLDDIQPRDKQDVGHRLALLARNKTYDEKILSVAGRHVVPRNLSAGRRF